MLAHREDLVAESTRIHNRLRWHLHDLDPEIEIPARRLSREIWLDRLERRLRRFGQDLRARLCRELVGRAKQNEIMEQAQTGAKLAAKSEFDSPWRHWPWDTP